MKCNATFCGLVVICFVIVLLLLVTGRNSPFIVIHYQTSIPSSFNERPTDGIPNASSRPDSSRFPAIVPSKPLVDNLQSVGRRLPDWKCPSLETTVKDKLQNVKPVEFPCPYCRQMFQTRVTAQQHCRTGHPQEVLKEGGERMCQIDDNQFTIWQEFYKVRAKQCELGTNSLPAAGTPWGSYKLHHFTALMKRVAQELGVRNGSSVFEAGFGCGQLLSRLLLSHDVLVSGIDITQDVVSVAVHNIGKLLTSRYPGLIITTMNDGSESARHRLCRGDVRDLSYLPSNSYHHAITFGVLFYLPTVQQVCQAAQELVRIVKPGGSVWFGCHQNAPDYDLPPLNFDFWSTCIHAQYPLARLRFVGMRQLLDSDLYDPDRRYSVFVDK